MDRPPNRENIGKCLTPRKIQELKSLYVEGHTMAVISRTCGVSVATVKRYREKDGWSSLRAKRVESQRDNLLMGETETGMRRVTRIDTILGAMERDYMRKRKVGFNPVTYERLLKIRQMLLETERKRTPFDSYEDLCRAFDMLKPGDVERLREGKRLRERKASGTLEGEDGDGQDDDSQMDYKVEATEDQRMLMDDDTDEDIDGPNTVTVTTEEGEGAKHPADPHPPGLGPPAL